MAAAVFQEVEAAVEVERDCEEGVADQTVVAAGEQIMMDSTRLKKMNSPSMAKQQEKAEVN